LVRAAALPDAELVLLVELDGAGAVGTAGKLGLGGLLEGLGWVALYERLHVLERTGHWTSSCTFVRQQMHENRLRIIEISLGERSFFPVQW
jgi:hypothetical protein